MNNYLLIAPAIFGVIATLVALFYKNKATTAETRAIISEVQAQDAPLVAQQAQDQSKIQQVDKGIQDMMAEREKLRNQYATDQQKADAWNTNPPPKS